MDASAVTASPPAPRWAIWVVRAIGLWILVGGLFKLLLGGPSDLPRVIHDLPIGPSAAYRLVIGVELFVGLVALLRPRLGWPLAGLLLLAFDVVLVTQIAAGTRSCGCFGAKVPIPPAAMLAIDVTLLVLLLAARPWRLGADRAIGLGVALAAVVVAIAAPILVDREATGPGRGGILPVYSGYWDVKAWKDKPLAETDLAKWTDLSHPMDGLWFIWSESCEICATCLADLKLHELGAREVTLVRLTQKRGADFEEKVHGLPEGPYIHTIDLPAIDRWDGVTPPVVLVVKDGKVENVLEGATTENCHSLP